MINQSILRLAVLGGVLFLLAVMSSAQRSRSLYINGKNAGPVMQLRGRNYVDIETLAQNTNATVTFQPDRIALTIGGAGAEEEPGLSRPFSSAALADVALMREWKGSIETMIAYRVPVTGTFLQDYQARAEEGLRQANVAATTPSDHSAYQLLQNEYSTLASWAGSAIADRQSLNATRTLGENVLKSDPVLEKISSCGRFLSSMLVSGSYSDNVSCR